MRLGALFLSAALAAAAAAQEPPSPRALPWQASPAPPWKPLPAVPEAAPPVAPSSGRLKARLEGDGTFSVWDSRGVRTLRAALPGRPLAAWRDGGAPLALGQDWSFPEAPPLHAGLGHLAWGGLDFRPSLEGLAWILPDGENYLTVANPSTAQVIYLPLPQGSGFRLDFQPDRLILVAAEGPPGLPGARAWALPWLALLPQLTRLGPPPQPRKLGTAILPFPN